MKENYNAISKQNASNKYNFSNVKNSKVREIHNTKKHMSFVLFIPTFLAEPYGRHSALQTTSLKHIRTVLIYSKFIHVRQSTTDISRE